MPSLVRAPVQLEHAEGTFKHPDPSRLSGATSGSGQDHATLERARAQQLQLQSTQHVHQEQWDI